MTALDAASRRGDDAWRDDGEPSRMSGQIAARVFIVGCPRSGTTLLQSFLAAHPRVASFPESQFFKSLSPKLHKRLLGIASPRVFRRLDEFLEAIDRPDLRARFPSGGWRARPFGRVFAEVLDELTLDEGKDVWLEKTPHHLAYIGPIRRVIRDAKFIHIVRAGEDVVASLYDVSRKHPDVWGGAWSIEQCLRHRNHSVIRHAWWGRRPGNIVVRYESLVAQPAPTLAKLCDFIGISFDERMIADRVAAVKAITRRDEPWTGGVAAEVRLADSKFETVFTEEQRQAVRRGLRRLPRWLSLERAAQ